MSSRDDIQCCFLALSLKKLTSTSGDNRRLGDHEARTFTAPFCELEVTNLSLPELDYNMPYIQQQRLTPAQLLGLDKAIPGSSFAKPIAATELLGHDVQGLAELESETNGDVLPPLPMNIQSTASSNSYKILASPPLFSSPESRRSSTTDILSSDVSRRSSWSTFDSPSLKMTMNDLKGVKM